MSAGSTFYDNDLRITRKNLIFDSVTLTLSRRERELRNYRLRAACFIERDRLVPGE